MNEIIQDLGGFISISSMITEGMWKFKNINNSSFS